MGTRNPTSGPYSRDMQGDLPMRPLGVCLRVPVTPLGILAVQAPHVFADDYPKFNASEDALGVTPSNTPKQRSMSFHTRSGSEAEEYLGYAFSGQRGEDPRLLSDTTSHVRSGTGRTHGSSPNTARSQRSDGPGAALNDAAVLNGVTTPSAPNGASTNLLDASSDYREVRASELLNGNAH